MAKKISEAVRVVRFFQTAELALAAEILNVGAATVKSRQPEQPPKTRTRRTGARASTAATSGAGTTTGASSGSSPAVQ